jgi:hypothetical protein
MVSGNVQITIDPQAGKRLCGVSGFEPDAGQGAALHTRQNEKSFGHDILLPA